MKVMTKLILILLSTLSLTIMGLIPTSYHKLKRDYNLTKEKMDDITYMYISDYHILTIQQKLDLEKLIKML
jgi:hypothetical protein